MTLIGMKLQESLAIGILLFGGRRPAAPGQFVEGITFRPFDLVHVLSVYLLTLIDLSDHIIEAQPGGVFLVGKESGFRIEGRDREIPLRD